MNFKCFLLLLGEEIARTYYFSASGLFLIKTSTADVRLRTKWVPDLAKGFLTDQDRKDALRHIFYHQIDDLLSKMLRSSPLPVLIIGNPVAFRGFRRLTKNLRNIGAYIDADPQPLTEEDILRLLAPSTSILTIF
jgi:hypothetical protein